MGNMDLYNAVRAVPPEALKPITGGKLKGKSDINPMWRLKTLTEQFGPCGIGWRYELVRFWTEPGAGGEVSAWAQINLYIRQGEEWSAAIPGLGGNMLVQTERGSLVTNDEAYKMCLTDALSVACKALGVAADIYWELDKSKYEKPDAEPHRPILSSAGKSWPKAIQGIKNGNTSVERILSMYQVSPDDELLLREAQNA